MKLLSHLKLLRICNSPNLSSGGKGMKNFLKKLVDIILKVNYDGFTVKDGI